MKGFSAKNYTSELVLDENEIYWKGEYSKLYLNYETLMNENKKLKTLITYFKNKKKLDVQKDCSISIASSKGSTEKTEEKMGVLQPDFDVDYKSLAFRFKKEKKECSKKLLEAHELLLEFKNKVLSLESEIADYQQEISDMNFKLSKDIEENKIKYDIRQVLVSAKNDCDKKYGGLSGKIIRTQNCDSEIKILQEELILLRARNKDLEQTLEAIKEKELNINSYYQNTPSYKPMFQSLYSIIKSKYDYLCQKEEKLGRMCRKMKKLLSKE